MRASVHRIVCAPGGMSRQGMYFLGVDQAPEQDKDAMHHARASQKVGWCRCMWVAVMDAITAAGQTEARAKKMRRQTHR